MSFLENRLSLTVNTIILVLIRFAKAKLFRTSYTVQKKNIFANLFSVGINLNEFKTVFKETILSSEKVVSSEAEL